MSLRVRLAAVFALFAILVVGVVSAVGFMVTEHRLRGKVDDVLVAYANRLAVADGRLASGVCNQFVRPGNDNDGRQGDGGDSGFGSGPRRPYDDFAGAVVQCVGVPDASVAVAYRNASVSAVRTVEVSDVSYRVITVSPSIGGTIQVARDAGEADEVVQALRAATVGLGIAVALAAAAAGWLTAHRLARPLERLTRAAEEVSTTGRFDVDVPSAGGDEAGRLARAFREMLASLDSSRARQQRLAQDAGHELRTPLTSLRTNIATLRRHPTMPADTKQQVLSDLELEVGEMSTMVDGLVALVSDATKDEAPEPVALDVLVHRAVDRIRRRTGRDVRVETTPLILGGRPSMLSSAIDNLLDNAAKFSPDDQPIEVTLANDSDGARLVVRDHGPGIPVGDLPNVFERFHRADSARTLPGSGLGLAIVDDAATAHGAMVTAANHPDGGAVLTIHWQPSGGYPSANHPSANHPSS